MTEFEQGQRNILVYLIQVAEKTEGAEVWRALFAEGLRNIERSAKLRAAECLVSAGPRIG